MGTICAVARPTMLADHWVWPERFVGQIKDLKKVLETGHIGLDMPLRTIVDPPYPNKCRALTVWYGENDAILGTRPSLFVYGYRYITMRNANEGVCTIGVKTFRVTFEVINLEIQGKQVRANVAVLDLPWAMQPTEEDAP